MNRIKHFMILALALAMSLGAWAQQEVLLTTINASSGFTNGTQTFDNIVTVTLNDVSYEASVGWHSLGSPRPVEVAPVNGVTVTGYMLYFSATDPIEYEGSSFTVALEMFRVLADDISTQLGSAGITKIEVYGYAADASPTVTHNTDGSWGFTMPDYNAALNVTYYSLPDLAWTYNSAAMPAEGLTAYRGFELPVIGGIGASMDEDFLTALQSGTVSLRFGSVNGVVTFIDPNNMQSFSVNGSGLDTVYMVFDGNDDYLRDSAFFAVNILNPDTLTLSANGNGSVSPLLGGDDVWNNETWANLTTTGSEHSFTVGDITLSHTGNEYEGFYQLTTSGNPLRILSSSGTLTFTSNGAPFTRIQLLMVNEYSSSNPQIQPLDGWSFDGRYATWEGNAQSVSMTQCTTKVDQIVFTRGSNSIVVTATEGQYLVIPGAEVQVVATAKDGNHVSAWSDNRQPQHYTSDTNTITVGESQTLTATFAQNPLLTLASNNGGTVTLDGDSIGTVYTFTFEHLDSPEDDRAITIPANRLPYDTTFSYNANIEFADAYDQAGESVSKIAQGAHTVTVRISGPFEYGGYYQCELEGGDRDDWTISCTTGTGPVTPNGITKTGDNTYRVLPGTQLSVTATPGEGSYLAQWSDQTEPVEGDARLGSSHPYTMPATPATLTATFNEIPVLTLASNNSEWGTVEMEGAGSGSSNGYTIKFSANGNTIVKENVTLPKTYQCEYGSPSEFDNIIRELYGWTGVHGNENAIPTVTGTDAITPGTESSRNYPKFTINSAFQGTATVTIGYTNSSWESDNWPIEISFVPALPAGVLATTEEGTYRVLPGTQLSVTATPDPAHYFVNWDEEAALNSNTAVEKTLTMGTAPATLTANFALKPTLTLAHNDGGEMEIVPEEVMAVNEFTVPSSWNNDNTLAAATDLPSDFQSVSETEARAWQNTTGHRVYLFYRAYPSGTVSYVRFNADGTVADVSTGLKSVIYNNVSDVYEGYLVRYTTVGYDSNFIASTAEPNTYYIDYNTSVTVKATPDATHYLVNFDNDADTNSNVAVEKTYGPLTAALTTAEATFNDKPVLTLAANDTTWGKVMLDGAASSNSSSETIAQFLASEVNNDVWHEITGTVSNITNTSYGNFDLTDNTASVYVYGLLTPDMQYRQFESMGIVEGTNITIMAHRGEYNSIPQANGAYLVSINTLPAGVAKLTDSTYRVDYGTTVTVVADATALHHVQGWDNGNGTELTGATYSDYFVTTPQNLFPAKSALTLTMTQDTVAEAQFGINSYDVTAMVAAGQAERGTVKALYTDIQGESQTAMRDTVEVSAQGGSTTTLVALPANSCFDFQKWMVGTEEYANDTITVDAATVAEAYFVYHQYTGDTVADECDQFSWHGETYTAVPTTEPTFVYKTVGDECDSTVTLHLTLRYATTGDTTAVSCDTYDWYEHTGITASTETLTHLFEGANAVGCDSTVTLHLTVNYRNTGDTTAVECDQFSWYEHTGLTASTETLTHLFEGANQWGCDSTVTLHLTVNYRNTGVETATACDEYKWQGKTYTESNTLDQRVLSNRWGCDSTVTLNLTVNYHHDTAFHAQGTGSYTWGLGTNYEEAFTENNVYHRTIKTYQGCDSNVTLTVAIASPTTPIPDIYTLMNVTLMINHFADEVADRIDYIYYRWYKNGEVVKEGVDADSYDEGGATLNGCYYLEISTDVNRQYWAKSNELCFGTTGIEAVESVNFNVMPNPAVRGQRVSINVEGNADLQGARLTVFDATGRMVENSEFRNSNFEIQTSTLNSGVYMLRLSLRDGRVATKRLVVK